MALKKTMPAKMIWSEYPYSRLCCPRHLNIPMTETRKNLRRLLTAPLLLLLLGSTVPPLQAALQPGDQEKEKEEKKQSPEAVIFGTVFSKEGFALRGIKVTAQHKDADKPKWKTVTDARGEFVIRLPRASGEYEIRTAAKKLQNQSKTIILEGAEKLNLLFRLAPLPEEKPGEKKTRIKK